ncbi:MAG: hypothetical protein IPL99_15555 [Candidatus Competibacteraceae bacterium]|nr:hypothetical protein [Candidatus Competibacteraceae bacterium]
MIRVDYSGLRESGKVSRKPMSLDTRRNAGFLMPKIFVLNQERKLNFLCNALIINK